MLDEQAIRPADNWGPEGSRLAGETLTCLFYIVDKLKCMLGCKHAEGSAVYSWN